MAQAVSMSGKTNALTFSRLLYLRQLYIRAVSSSAEDGRMMCTEKSNTNNKSSLPKYNHGLSGSGKYLHKRYKKKISFQIDGEVLFGTHPVHIALLAGKRKCHRLFIKKAIPDSTKDILKLAESMKIEHQLVSGDDLFKLSGDRPHNGVCMDVSPLAVPRLSADTDMQNLATNKTEPPIWLLPYKVKDPMNFGAILRSSYFLGVDRILIPEKDCSSLSPVVSKASSGALEVMDISSYKNFTMLMEFLQIWKSKGGRIVGASNNHEGKKTTPVHSYKIDCPTLVIMGNEEKGIHDSVLDDCDVVLHVAPKNNLHSAVDSLNVSVATGIILHALVNNR